MPRGSDPTKAEEVFVPKPPAKKPFPIIWFDQNVSDNKAEMLAISEVTLLSCLEQFRLEVGIEKKALYAVIFFGTFEAILQYLRSKQKTFNKYTIQLFNSINIGYSNSNAKENEKVGNFMPVMEYIGVNRHLADPQKVTSDISSTNYNAWKTLNSKKNVEHYDDIQKLAFERLRTEYKIDLRTDEAVWPIFCVFMDNINNVLRMKFREAQGTKVSQIKISVMGIFDAYYSYDETIDKEYIEYTPKPFFKLRLKNDSSAAMD